MKPSNVLKAWKRIFDKRNYLVWCLGFCTLYFCWQCNQANFCQQWHHRKQLKLAQKGGESVYERRVQHIQQICRQLDEGRGFISGCKYRSYNAKFNQQLRPSNYIQDPKTGTVLCYNLKVAATSWMRYFAEVENNQHYLESLKRGEKLYKIVDRLGLSQNGVLEKSLEENSFLFTLVRHPLDRLLSAYSNRILDTSTDQHKRHVPRMMNQLTGMLYKQDDRPVLADFLVYAAEGNEDDHWLPYYKACSPCLVPFTAVLKLEDGIEGVDWVLHKSGMGIHTKWHNDVENRSNSSRSLLRHVPCTVLEQVYRTYLYDFILFEYSISQYLADINVHCNIDL